MGVILSTDMERNSKRTETESYISVVKSEGEKVNVKVKERRTYVGTVLQHEIKIIRFIARSEAISLCKKRKSAQFKKSTYQLYNKVLKN